MRDTVRYSWDACKVEALTIMIGCCFMTLTFYDFAPLDVVEDPCNVRFRVSSLPTRSVPVMAAQLFQLCDLPHHSVCCPPSRPRASLIGNTVTVVWTDGLQPPCAEQPPAFNEFQSLSHWPVGHEPVNDSKSQAWALDTGHWRPTRNGRAIATDTWEVCDLGTWNV